MFRVIVWSGHVKKGPVLTDIPGILPGESHQLHLFVAG